MKTEGKELLSKYIKSCVSPILLNKTYAGVFKNPVVIESDCSLDLLNGHYEGDKFIAPGWYNELIQRKTPVLLINGINNIPTEQQYRFIEILKYRKVNTFELPSNCVIVATYSDLEKKPISEELYSLMAQI